ncbi:MAG: secretion protein F, partial [Paenibacillus macerans]|nr:secretion protein F [Paenibacillus macerans]
AERLPLTDYYRRKMEATLRSAGIRLTPEVFVAQAVIKAGLIFCAGIALLPLLPLLSPLLIFLAITLFFKDIRSADEAVRKKREQIETELPRFVATISQELKASRDVLRILEAYASNAGESLNHELQMTIADMKSGNLETALIRLETRIGSTMLSDVVRGLLAVLRGDQGVVYFEMLAHDFKLLEIQRLKRIAMKRPGKIRKYSFLMLACFMLTYMVIIGMEIFRALGKLF